MMNADPLILVAIPFIGGAAVLAVDRLLKRARDAVSLLVMAGLLAVNSRECYRTFFGHSALGALTAASGMVLDPPGLMVSELVLIVALLSMVFSIKYMRRELGGGGGSFYALFLAFVGTLMGLAFSTNILLMLFFLEASSVISAVLILYGGRGRRAVRATAIYLGLSVIESILVVLGVFTLASAIAIPPLDMTSVDISTLYGRSPLGHGVTVAALLLLLGFGTKAGLAPLGMIWLPPAYSEAPAPVSAMLSGVMSKAGFLAMFRCAHALATHSPYYVMAFLVLCSLLSIVLGIVGALIDSDVKRVLAYSSIAQMGYIAFGAGLGLVLLSAQTAGTVGLALKALKGGFYHLMNHSIFKSLLFLASGIFWYHLREREFKKMRGVGLKMPVTTALWLLGSWSMAGLFWPLNGYFSKHLILEACELRILDPLPRLEFTHLYLYGLNGVTVFVVSLLTFYCLTKIGVIICLGSSELKARAKEAPYLMLVPMLVLGVLCFITGGLYNTLIEEGILDKIIEYYRLL